MIKKHPEIIKFIKLVNNTFGHLAPIVNDNWDGDSCAVGLQQDNKLMYIAFYNKDDYFYECEFLTIDSDNPYVAEESNNATKKELLKVISRFFEIPEQNKS